MNFLISIIFFVLFSFNSIETEAKENVCKNDQVSFNTLGLAQKNDFKLFNYKTSQLNLVGAAMRRKNLLVMEVDVYKVGLYLSDQKVYDINNFVILLVFPK